MKNKICLLLLVTQALGQLYPYTSYWSQQTTLQPTNMLTLQTKWFQGLNTTNSQNCTSIASDPFFLVNCDKGELQVWLLKDVLTMWKKPTRTLIA